LRTSPRTPVPRFSISGIDRAKKVLEVASVDAICWPNHVRRQEPGKREADFHAALFFPSIAIFENGTRLRRLILGMRLDPRAALIL